MEKRLRENETLALWLAPVVSTIPLIPFLSIRSSPYFLGTLMDDPTHPMTWQWWGPLLSAMGVVFDGTILGYLTGTLLAVPVWLVLREHNKLSMLRVSLLFALAGLIASQVAHLMGQGFRQPDLRNFAGSWLSAVLGILCGFTAGAFAVSFATIRLPGRIRLVICVVPVVVLVICGATMVGAASVWRAH
jgi:hypothetical protein